MPLGRGFVLVSFNIFINDLEEGVNSTSIIASDANLGFVACTKGKASERGRQEMDPAWKRPMAPSKTSQRMAGKGTNHWEVGRPTGKEAA